MTGNVLIWLVIAVVLGIVEGATVSLVSIWMAVGAFVAGISAALGAEILTQMLIFVGISAILLLLTAPLTKKFRNRGVSKTNADRVIDNIGIVIEKIDPIERKGQIKVMGQVWSAISDEVIEAGETVIVTEIKGVRAVVKRQV